MKKSRIFRVAQILFALTLVFESSGLAAGDTEGWLETPSQDLNIPLAQGGSPESGKATLPGQNCRQSFRSLRTQRVDWTFQGFIEYLSVKEQ
ncbi:MAG: hypothetical protein ACT4NX_01880 [Deltaproteobacteria bacterium]